MRELNQQELQAVSGGDKLDLGGMIDMDFDQMTDVFTMVLDGDIDMEFDLTPIREFMDKVKAAFA